MGQGMTYTGVYARDPGLEQDAVNERPCLRRSCVPSNQARTVYAIVGVTTAQSQLFVTQDVPDTAQSLLISTPHVSPTSAKPHGSRSSYEQNNG